MADNSGIHFILTGGTIDSYYNGTKDTATPNEHSIIPEVIKSFNLNGEFSFTEVCMNGEVFDPEEVVKLISEGRFASIFNK